MAHEIESMFFVHETPWHRLGTRLDAPPTTREAIVAAGLDWEIGLKPLVTSDGEPVTHRATYRKSDGAILGVVGPAWVPLQNAEAFAFFDPFLGAGEATLETAGSLREGKRVWVLAKMNRAPSVIVPKADDVVEKFILLSNSHDGSLAVRVGFTPVRVVCANTLSLAFDDKASKLIRVRHQKNMERTLAAVRDVMNVANTAFEATAEQYRRLARTDIVASDLSRYVQLVFQPNKARVIVERPANDVGEESDKSRMHDTIAQLFESGRGNALPGVRGTLWAAYNAVTEYVSHERGRSDETRLNALFNDGAQLNQRALDVALAMAA